MKKTMLILLVVFLTLSSLIISLEIHSMDVNFYLDNYEEHNIKELTGKSKKELENITIGIIEYLKNDSGNEALRPHFNEREILHMEDVQVLFKNASIIKYISIFTSFLIIIFFIKKQETDLMGRYLFKGMFVNWMIVVLLLIMIFFDFNKYFTYFHLIFFSNDLWLLDPKTDLMIQMLPEDFFINIAIKIGITFFFFIAIIQGIGYKLSVRKKN